MPTILQYLLGIKPLKPSCQKDLDLSRVIPSTRVWRGTTTWSVSTHLGGPDILHRIDGPAVITPDREIWYHNGVAHRDYEPAYTLWRSAEDKNNNRQPLTMQWLQYGKHHREDGPAVIWDDGTEEYYLNGKRHRKDGPAVIFPWNGGDQFWLDDEPVAKESVLA
jgi:hypothetical protein